MLSCIVLIFMINTTNTVKMCHYYDYKVYNYYYYII